MSIMDSGTKAANVLARQATGYTLELAIVCAVEKEIDPTLEVPLPKWLLWHLYAYFVTTRLFDRVSKRHSLRHQ